MLTDLSRAALRGVRLLTLEMPPAHFVGGLFVDRGRLASGPFPGKLGRPGQSARPEIAPQPLVARESMESLGERILILRIDEPGGPCGHLA